jgi:hypothetical protein
VHPYLSEALARLDESRAVLATALEEVPAPLRRTRPEPGRWSAAEVLEHLALVDRFFAGRIAASIAEARVAGLGPESGPRQMLTDDVRSRMVDRLDRRAAREAMMPIGAAEASAAWADLDRARQTVRDAVAGSDGLALGLVTAEHRFFGTLNVYQWIELTAAHEIRHADQIREIARALRV